MGHDFKVLEDNIIVVAFFFLSPYSLIGPIKCKRGHLFDLLVCLVCVSPVCSYLTLSISFLFREEVCFHNTDTHQSSILFGSVLTEFLIQGRLFFFCCWIFKNKIFDSVNI